MGGFWLELLGLLTAGGMFAWSWRLDGMRLSAWVFPVQVSATVLLTLVLIRLAALEPFEGIGPSMQPTFPEHSKVLVNKSAYGWRLPGGWWVWRRATPLPGQVVVLEGRNARSQSEYLLKRVIAVGGDEVRIEGDHLFVNGEALEASPDPSPLPANAGLVAWSAQVLGHPHKVFLKAGQHPRSSEVVTWKVHPGYVFVLGDNRAYSYDSRDFGPVAEKKVLGQVVGVWKDGRLAAVDGPVFP